MTLVIMNNILHYLLIFYLTCYRYFSCQSPKERDEWIASLKKTLMMNEDRRRTDNSLRLDVLEVKGLPEKKKYYAEILVDDKL